MMDPTKRRQDAWLGRACSQRAARIHAANAQYSAALPQLPGVCHRAVLNLGRFMLGLSEE